MYLVAATNSTVGDPEVGSMNLDVFFWQIPYLVPSPNLSNKMVGNKSGVELELELFFFSRDFFDFVTLMNGFGNWLMDGCLLLDTWNLSFFRSFM